MRLCIATVVEFQNKANWNRKGSSQRQIKGKGLAG